MGYAREGNIFIKTLISELYCLKTAQLISSLQAFKTYSNIWLNSKFQNSENRTNIDCWRTTPIASRGRREEEHTIGIGTKTSKNFWPIQVTPTGGHNNHRSIYVF